MAATEAETWESLLARQEALEDIGVAKGRDRFLKALRKAEELGRPSHIGGAHTLLIKALDRIEEGIIEWKQMVTKSRGPKPVALHWLSLIEPEVAAYLTIKVLLDGLHLNRSVYSISLQIAGMIEDELVYRELRKQKPALFQYLQEQRGLKNKVNYRSVRGILGQAVRSNMVDVAHLRIPKAEKIHVGTKCLDLAITVTGLFRVELVNIRKPVGGRGYTPSQKRDQWQVIAEPTTIAWVEQKNDVLQWLTPMALPMIVPPLPWAPGEPGGYRFGLRGKYDMVRGVSDTQQGVVSIADIPMVYQALNLVQATAWKINPRILATVCAIASEGGNVGGVPPLEPEPIPPRPSDGVFESKEAKKAWRINARDTIIRNGLRAQVALKFHRIVREAEMVQHEETLFFPHNLDFRGRLYPIATYLSPQGDDLCKGLLTFAEGKPLGVEGAKALAVHGANCMDTDPATGEKLGQKTLAERQQWVEKNRLDILVCAGDPLENRWWTQADKPLQFLAFCIEWTCYLEQGPSYVCSLPVYVDGSCNGLQHFAAMFRDEIGGSAVNLTANERPADVYQRIADTTQDICRSLSPADPDYPLARRWLASGLLTRKFCKRPTMTFGYGSKVYGFQDQLLEYLSVDLRDSWDATRKHFTFSGQASILQAVRMIARGIWSALERSVVKAFEGMDWLQQCAKTVCANTKDGITWTVPITGFPVKQEYYVQQKKSIRTVLAGKVVRPTLYTPTSKPLLLKQQNAVSPNVIHSLDAAALMLAVDYAMKEGVTAFAAIHDSYGTIPADMPIVARAARQGFHRLYTERDVPGWLYRQFADQSQGEVPLPPSPGTLDLDQVLESDYFFA